VINNFPDGLVAVSSFFVAVAVQPVDDLNQRVVLFF